ncbi:MAG: hypothetical protein FWF69_01730 [Firmicutes bacterium]|nr:hypothetical protein [Bacillota bacterium]
MAAIKIFLLGKFDIMVGNKSAFKVLSSSKKGRMMLVYLILHKDESILSSDLYEVLWPNEASSNPESALKTLVSRVRAALGKFDDTLSKCIVTSRGAYRWNGGLQCVIDVFEFEGICRELAKATVMNRAVEDMFEKALTMYAGDLNAGNDGEGWMVSHSAYYHALYLRTAYLAIRLLKENKDCEGIIRVCRRALDVDAFDETMHLELMEALVKTNRSNEALMQYRHATNLHYNYLGTRPPEKIQNFYKQIIHADQSLGMDIDSIRKSLQAADSTNGAFLCEYAVFKDIYRLLMRSFSRIGGTMFLAVVMLSSSGGQAIEPLVLDSAMRQLLNAMIASLRRGDTVTRYSPSQYALLLPAVNYETGRMVLERIRTLFYRQCVDSSLTFAYKLGPVEDT